MELYYVDREMIPEPPPPRESTVVTNAIRSRHGSDPFQSLPSHRRVILPSSIEAAAIDKQSTRDSGGNSTELINTTSSFAILSSKPHQRRATKAILAQLLTDQPVKATTSTTTTITDEQASSSSSSSSSIPTTKDNPRSIALPSNNNNNNKIISLTSTVQEPTNVTIASLQNNIMALSLFNRREKSLNEDLERRVESLSKELERVNGLLEEQSKLNETLQSVRIFQQRDSISSTEGGGKITGGASGGGGGHGGGHGGGNGRGNGHGYCICGYQASANETAAAAAASFKELQASMTEIALKEKNEMELTFQRKLLGLESQCRDLSANNKRLLAKIHLLENADDSSKSAIQQVESEKNELLNEVDTLQSTIHSQTTMILGLRSMILEIQRDDQEKDNLTRQVERLKQEVTLYKTRDKKNKEESLKERFLFGKDKAIWFAKIQDLQTKLDAKAKVEDDLLYVQENLTKLTQEHQELKDFFEKEQKKAMDLTNNLNLVQHEKMALFLEKNHLQGFLNEKTHENMILQQEVVKLQQMLINLKQDKEIEVISLQQENIEFTKELKQSTQKYEMLIQEYDQLKQNQIHLEELTSEKNNWLEEKNKLEKQARKLMLSLQQLQQQQQEQQLQQKQQEQQQKSYQEHFSRTTTLTTSSNSTGGQEDMRASRATTSSSDSGTTQENIVVNSDSLETTRTSTGPTTEGNDSMQSDEEDYSSPFFQQQQHHQPSQGEGEQEKQHIVGSPQATGSQSQEIPQKQVQANEEEEEEEEDLIPHGNLIDAKELDVVRAEKDALRLELTSTCSLLLEETSKNMALVEDMNHLKADIESLHLTMQSMENDLTRYAARKYQTEAFQSQVRLLQSETEELISKLNQTCMELAKEKYENQEKTVEILHLKQLCLDPQVVDLLKKTQENLNKTVSSLVESEKASESIFTCLQCMQLYTSSKERQPLTLTPCGHSFCQKCFQQLGGNLTTLEQFQCIECSSKLPNKPTTIVSVFTNKTLADLTARFLFRQQNLATMSSMCQELRDSFLHSARTVRLE